MGVQGFWQIAQPCARPTNIATLHHRRLAVDASIWIYQFLKAVRDQEGHALQSSHIVGFFRRICKLLWFGIKPVFVFDGEAPPLKRQTIQQRQRRREGHRDDVLRSAGKLLAMQMKRVQQQQAPSRHGPAPPPASTEEEVDPMLDMSQEVYADEVGMSLSERRQARQSAAFAREDAYHLPALDAGGITSMGGNPEDPRIMGAEELEEYARQFHRDEDINLYDFSKIDFDGDFFQSLPAADRYSILNAARLRSRLRMGLSKDELEVMFPDRMAFSRFQIERVQERNRLTQRLMKELKMEGLDLTMTTTHGRVVGEKDREYILVRNEGAEGGWALGVVSRQKDVGESHRPIDVDTPTFHFQSREKAEEEEEEAEEGDDDFEDVPIEGLNRLPRLGDGNWGSELEGSKEELGRNFGEDFGEETLFVGDDAFVGPRALVGEVVEGEEENEDEKDAEEEDEEEAQLRAAIAMSLERHSPQDSTGEASRNTGISSQERRLEGRTNVGRDGDPDSDGDRDSDRETPVWSQRAVAPNRPIAAAGRGVAHLVNHRANALVTGKAATLAPRESAVNSTVESTVRLGSTGTGADIGRRGKVGKKGTGDRVRDRVPDRHDRLDRPSDPRGHGAGESDSESDHEVDLRAVLSRKQASTKPSAPPLSTPLFDGPLPFPTISWTARKASVGDPGETRTNTSKNIQDSVAPVHTVNNTRDLEERKDISPTAGGFTRPSASPDDAKRQAAQGDLPPWLPTGSDLPDIREQVRRQNAKELAERAREREDELALQQVLVQSYRPNSPQPVDVNVDIADVDASDIDAAGRNVVIDVDSPAKERSLDDELDNADEVGGRRTSGQTAEAGDRPVLETTGDQPNALGTGDWGEAAVLHEPESTTATKDMEDWQGQKDRDTDDKNAAGADAEDTKETIVSETDVPSVETIGRPDQDDVDAFARALESGDAFAEDDLFARDGQDVQEAQVLAEEDEELWNQMAEELAEHQRFTRQLQQQAAGVSTAAASPTGKKTISREEARQEYEREVRALQTQQRKDRRDADEVSDTMVRECQALLRLFGIPYVTAPTEAEAQCAELVRLGLVDGIITDDSDTFLFGGTRVYKNMFNSHKFVECYLASDLEQELSLGRRELIQLALLLGSDYTEGVAGIGPVKALEILSEFPGPRGLEAFRDWWDAVVMHHRSAEADASSTFRAKFRKSHLTKLTLPTAFPSQAVVDAYLRPTVDASTEAFQWGVPNLDGLRRFLMATVGWTADRTDEVLVPVIRDMNRRERDGTQANITRYFEGGLGVGARAREPSSSSSSASFDPMRGGLRASKRMTQAVQRLKQRTRGRETTGEADHEDASAKAAPQRASKRRRVHAEGDVE